MDSYDLNTTFLSVDDTKNVFPTLRLKKENLPVGNSIKMCVAMLWSKREVAGITFMKEIEGFPDCSQVSSGKFIWNDDDIPNGVDIPVWKQTRNVASCSDAYCDSYCKRKYQGAFVDAGETNLCYTYQILKRICLIVKYDENKNAFSYKGGCFKGGEAYEMEIAEPGKEYSFDDIEITVREEGDPLIEAGKMSKYTYSFGKGCKIVAIILNIVLILNVLFLGYIIYYIFNDRIQKPTKLIGRDNE